MSVSIGANAQLLLDGYDLTGFFSEFSVDMSRDSLDATVFGLGSRSKVQGLRHAKATGSALYDDALTTGSWDVLKLKYPSGTAGTWAFAPTGFAVGNRVVQLYSEAIKFEPRSLVGDLVKVMTEAEALSNAADLGVALHAIGAETSLPFSGTAVDNLAATANGGVGTVHVTAIVGSAKSVIYKIQHSVDGSTWVDLVTFTAITAANSFQRVEISSGTTIRRYLRETITENGTTTSVTGVTAFSRR